MSVSFDPKKNNIAPPAAQAPAPKAEEALLENPYADPPAVVSEMDLLFSGHRHLQKFQAEQRHDPIRVPDFNKDLLGPMPKLGSHQSTFQAVLGRYKLLRKNLLDRRHNYLLSLELPLRPEEAFDLQQRIQEINEALYKIEKNLKLAKNWEQKISSTR